MAQTSELGLQRGRTSRVPAGRERNFWMRRRSAKNHHSRRTNAHRDQNPGMEWPKIRAETPYLASYRKRAVCGDWMVADAVQVEPVSTPNSCTGKLTGILQIQLLCGDFGAQSTSEFNDLHRNSLRDGTGNFWRPNREFFSKNREFSRQNARTGNSSSGQFFDPTTKVSVTATHGSVQQSFSP